MRYDYDFLLKKQCLIEALIQTTGYNQIHDQQGLLQTCLILCSLAAIPDYL